MYPLFQCGISQSDFEHAEVTEEPELRPVYRTDLSFVSKTYHYYLMKLNKNLMSECRMLNQKIDYVEYL
jgi:hypothetical protein